MQVARHPGEGSSAVGFLDVPRGLPEIASVRVGEEVHGRESCCLTAMELGVKPITLLTRLEKVDLPARSGRDWRRRRPTEGKSCNQC